MMRPPWFMLPRPKRIGPAVGGHVDADDLIIPQVPTSACPCRLTNALMADMGMTLAAKMHLQPTTARWEWTDQREHAREEDVAFFPYVRRAADTFSANGSDHGRKLHKAVAHLVEDHVAFERDYWSRGLAVPPEKFAPHGALEERIVALYEVPIRIEAGLLTTEEADAMLARAA